MSDVLTPEALALEQQFTAAFTAQAGFFYPYTLVPSDGPPFRCNVWQADPRSRAYAHAVASVPDLVQADVRFMTVKPGDELPGREAVMALDGGTLTLRMWGQLDPVSGERIAACTWESGLP